MVKSRGELCPRKASWLAFGIAACAIVASATNPEAGVSLETTTTTVPSQILALSNWIKKLKVFIEFANHAPHSSDGASSFTTLLAARAYKQALATLSALKPHPSQYVFDASLAAGNSNTKSIFNSFLPNLQGQGPIGSAVRIILKLHHFATSAFGQERLGLGGSGKKKKDEELRGKSIKVMDLLQHSAELGNLDALYTLAMVSLFPPNQYFKHDPQLAYTSLSTHASITGNASAQAYLAFFHASGYRSIVPADQAKAQLYYTFAANGGDKGAQMALGYRYWSGIGTQDSCDKALLWYGYAAEQAMAKFLSGPPGGRTLPQTATRLSDLVGGIYGPGASVASTGINGLRPAIKAGLAQAAGETWEDVLEYYLFNADRGEIDFAYRLGKIFYQGSIYASAGGISSGSEGVGTIPRNYRRARHYFLSIARQVWPNDPPSTAQAKESENKPVGYAAASAAYLGRMYLRGEGVKQDPILAKAWFERGAALGERECQNGLGIIYRDALVPGSRPDIKRANNYFKVAATQDLPEAQVNLGKYHYNRGEIAIAVAYFENAVRNGAPFEAYYYLAEIQASQATNPNVPKHVSSGSCAMAVSFYKIVAERGVWDDDLLREAEMAWMAGTDEDQEVAMLKWWLAAERGLEVAQNNLGYVLDQDKSILRLTRFSPMTPSNDTASLALTQWIRAAGQRNIDALVKVGDYYYHGLGVSSQESEQSRLEKAARYYQSAADTQMSALAMWNLGWMYENGIGVPQDFHLAKRHYDLALETNSEAYLPVMLSLVKLYARSIWHTLMGGSGGLSIWSPDPPDTDDTKKRQALMDAKKAKVKKLPIVRTMMGLGILVVLEKNSTAEEPTVFLQVKKILFRERRDAERERDSDFGPEDYFEGALRGGRVEDGGVDEFAETMLLVLLCLVISVLLYIRTRIVERMRRDQQQEDNNQRNRNAGNPDGVFPPPGDPARADWAILR
ncbi:MMS2 [Coprinopsis cinerea okayama7|uniref:MMS2 n=1 Tax=Coprinopsis cinerea (strain Okayama-7 / 130 / ATCC MYA-4618 / FGSC 9003) TaxID=240176 RepID=A8N5Y9_COPC7|nr:MMS2 [Coprinopsis cinerea okayama7\|eukprot:XP_001830284.2 MMS2 [Coprinopsis cinerea okayama7\